VNIYLIGMMGSGKSSVGKVLAKQLRWRFVDSDTLIEKRVGLKVAQIFAKSGEKAFRKMESEVIQRLSYRDSQVIATGGGAPRRLRNWKSFTRNGIVVWLKAGSRTLLRRLRAQGQGERPVLREISLRFIRRLLSQRKPFYRMADLKVRTDSFDQRQVADRIVKRILSLRR
jgi:shikimate kinase